MAISEISLRQPARTREKPRESLPASLVTRAASGRFLASRRQPAAGIDTSHDYVNTSLRVSLCLLYLFISVDVICIAILLLPKSGQMWINK